jgi:hypothetical protein
VLVLLGGGALAELVQLSLDGRRGQARVERVDTADAAIEAVIAHEPPVLFAAWADAEPEVRELLARVPSSAWLSSVTTVVLTSGRAEELSAAYALGARVALGTPEDVEAVTRLLDQLDQLLGTG